MSEIVIFGCGGQGREIAAMVATAGTHVLGVFDDGPSTSNLSRLRHQGHDYLGTTERLADVPVGTFYLIGIADGGIREAITEMAEAHQLRPYTFVHPSATVGVDCSLESGTVIWPGARLTTNIVVGRHVHINQNATVGHDTRIDAYATINPSAAISGDCHIGERALIGAASVVLQGLTVSSDATVGAAACVTHDVDTAMVVMGVPARS